MMRYKILLLSTAGPLAVLLLLSGCEQKPQIRQYTEIDIRESRFEDIPAHQGIDRGMPSAQSQMQTDPSMDMSSADSATQQMINASVAEVSMTWTVPDGWREEPSGGMRLATFQSSGDDPVLCTIISLGGMAGGIEQNITRWMGQLGIQNISQEQLQAFIYNTHDVSTASGESAAVFDFNRLLDPAGHAASSMMAAILEGPSKTVFIKMTGSQDAVAVNAEKFTALLASIQMK
ncbi:MAG: hypothetical protein KC713_00910 [Candidatus Omnitrophica bacterium]|nr:hypothetical protein [Candidatus Omnitrophota bacterium]